MRMRSGTHWIPVALMFAVGVELSCGTKVATIPLVSVGTPGETPIALPEGTRLSFPVTVSRYSYRGSSALNLDVELLNRGTVVRKMSCTGFRTKSGSGAGCSTMQQNSSCEATVPAGGITSVRVNSHITGFAPRLEGLEVQVRVL